MYACSGVQDVQHIHYSVDRLGALFGVSILGDKGHARNELWDIVYQISSVICKFSTFSFEY